MTESMNKRDISIIVAVLIVVIAGYFIIVYPDKAGLTEAAQPQSAGRTMAMTSAMPVIEGLPEDYQGLVQSGNTFMDQGNYPMAAECYRRSLELEDVDDVRVDHGACLNAMGLPDRAIEEFQIVLGHNPNHAIAIFNLGIVYYGNSQPDSADVYFKRYLQIEPDGPAAPTARNLLKEMRGDN